MEFFPQHRHKQMRAVAVLAFLGILATSYLLYLHFRPAAGGSFCNINDYVNCDIVNKSKYAEIFGIPISAIGLSAYLILFYAALALMKSWRFRISLPYMTAFAGLGLAISLVFTYIEFFILRALCLFCITQQILILLIFLILLHVWRKKSVFLGW